METSSDSKIGFVETPVERRLRWAPYGSPYSPHVLMESAGASISQVQERLLPSQINPFGPSFLSPIPVFGIALDQGEPGSEADGFFESAVESATTTTLDPLNILQIAERTDINDQRASTSKSGPAKGPIGKADIDDGPDGPGNPHANRWVVEWGNDTEAGYRRKLDHLGITLGAVRDGQLVGAFKGFEFARRESVTEPPKLWFVHQNRDRVEVDSRPAFEFRVETSADGCCGPVLSTPAPGANGVAGAAVFP